jgi:hypothetical protein
MRHVLVDYARERLRQKRGGGAVHVPIDAAVVLSSQQVEHIVAVDLRRCGPDVCNAVQ